MTKALWAGLDVGVETTSLCVVDAAGTPLHECVCRTDLKEVVSQLRFLRRRRRARVGIEAGSGIALARGLRNLGYSVDIYETRQLSKFLRVRRNKTDATDARGIAEAGRIGAFISKVYLKDIECQTLQSWLTIRRHIIRQRVSATNLLCRQIEYYGGRVSRPNNLTRLRGAVRDELKKVFGTSTSEAAAELKFLLSVCEHLMVHEYETDSRLRRLAKSNELCRRFMTIPGVGPICALSFYATVGEPGRFTRSSDVGPYLGLTPQVHESGLTSRKGHISKMGNSATRCLLVQSANLFMRHSQPDCTLRRWVEQLERRRSRGAARVALARKLATIMIAMWRSGEAYQPTWIAIPY